MAVPLAIDVELVTGSYEAQLPEPGWPPEWPPHPYRIFAALVEAAGASQTEQEEQCLVAMSALGAPSVRASRDAWTTKTYTVYVPGSTTAADGDQKTYTRQPIPANRATVTDVPKIYFIWPDAPNVDRDVLAKLLARVGRLGRCGGVVVAGLGNAAVPVGGMSSWEPDEQGREELRVATRATLDTMRKVYEGNMGDYPSFRRQRYRRLRTDEDAKDVASGPWGELFCYRLVGRPPLRGVDALAICDSARSAVLNVVMRDNGATPPQQWTGHQADGTPTTDPHVAFVPLVFSHAEHADGRVLGIGVAIPEGTAAPPMPPTISFCGHSYTIESADDLLRQPVTLQERRWTRPSTLWATVTPVALRMRPTGKRVVRNGGAPHWRPRKPATSDKVNEEVAMACEKAGFPAPIEVLTGPDPVVTGSEPARNYLSRRRHDDPPRRLVHAVVRFGEPVMGPVAVGFYRHFGLGLMTPLDEKEMTPLDKEGLMTPLDKEEMTPLDKEGLMTPLDKEDM